MSLETTSDEATRVRQDHEDQDLADKFERKFEWPLTAVAVVFLVAYAWPILDTHLAEGWRRVCYVLDLATWVVFAADYVTRVVLARHRARYVFRHIPDLLIVILPIFRPLRLLRLILLLKILNRRASDSFRGRVVAYVVGATVVLLFCGALAVLDAERGHAGSNINSFGDALWWSVVTVSTVGYGDYYPVTVTGRLVAVGLMIGGVALIGVVTATFASWLIDRVRSVVNEAGHAGDDADDVHLLRAEIRELRAELSSLRTDLGARLPARPPDPSPRDL